MKDFNAGNVQGLTIGWNPVSIKNEKNTPEIKIPFSIDGNKKRIEQEKLEKLNQHPPKGVKGTIVEENSGTLATMDGNIGRSYWQDEKGNYMKATEALYNKKGEQVKFTWFLANGKPEATSEILADGTRKNVWYNPDGSIKRTERRPKGY